MRDQKSEIRNKIVETKDLDDDSDDRADQRDRRIQGTVRDEEEAAAEARCMRFAAAIADDDRDELSPITLTTEFRLCTH